jgi:hypothetical protein
MGGNCISHPHENSILRPTFSPGVHIDPSFARERPQSNRKSFSATPALMGSGSLEAAFASGVPSIMNEKAIRTNDTATFANLSMTIPPLTIFLVSRFANTESLKL